MMFTPLRRFTIFLLLSISALGLDMFLFVSCVELASFFFNLRTENSFFHIFDKNLATILRGAFHHIVKGRFPESSFFSSQTVSYLDFSFILR